MRQELLCTYGGPILMDLRFQRQWLFQKQVLLKRHVPRWREGNVWGIVIPVDNMDEFSVLLTEIEESEGAVELTPTTADIVAARERGVFAIILMATFKAVGSDIESLKLYRKLGMRTFALALNPGNLLTDGCGERQARGLTFLGIRAVQEMERLGTLIDLSHTSDQGFWDVLQHTTCPVYASHSNARTVNENGRNLSDDQIRALAERGGVVGLSTYPTLVSWKQQPTIDDYLDHVDHLKRLVGVEHIAIGTDFIDYVYDMIMPGIRKTDPTKALYGDEVLVTEGLANIADLKNIRPGLEARGYTEAEIEAILSGNFLRLLKAMEEQD